MKYAKCAVRRQVNHYFHQHNKRFFVPDKSVVHKNIEMWENKAAGNFH
jgi:hypothetical protein